MTMEGRSAAVAVPAMASMVVETFIVTDLTFFVDGLKSESQKGS